MQTRSTEDSLNLSKLFKRLPIATAVAGAIAYLPAHQASAQEAEIEFLKKDRIDADRREQIMSRALNNEMAMQEWKRRENSRRRECISSLKYFTKPDHSTIKIKSMYLLMS